MKTKKRLALLLMMVLAVSLFAGCGSKEPEKKGSQNVEGDTSKEDADKNDGDSNDDNNKTEGDTTEGNKETEGDTNTSGIQFPLAEKKELSVWLIWSNS